MTQADLIAEIQGIVERECFAAKRAAEKGWLVAATLEAHPEATELAPFPLLCVREHVEDSVELVVRRINRRPKDPEDRQMDFHAPGFERVQDGYIVERDGKSMLVPTELLTIYELRAKAKEHRRMGEGHQEHADELDRLADTREAAGR